ncbi:TipC family immunity protein [Vagococcus sp. BWB3-3]|uniref:TipC family immunity protein n=1 Tax=Vagococcus allomyrinae TaxID=2794353 RepID=A0A940P923_9ENTE|nr:TipC family immunity protein [Vagococcus allomyrinae]MBP1040187.1 TipC family immunity protein [Vagococcus allomyrinae]
MKNPLKKLLILLVCLIGILISASIYEKIKFQTIFDEIYYDSRNASGESFDRRSSLGDIKGMSASATKLTGITASKRESIIMESYEDDSLKAPMNSLRISNNSTKKELRIGYSYMVTENMTLFFDNVYYVKNRELTKEISLVEIDSNKRITTQKEVKDTLTSCEITAEQLAAWDYQGLNEVFLTDWVSVYPSNYSPDNLVNVTIKTAW